MANAEDEAPEEAAPVSRRAEAGATRDRRAGLDPRRLSHARLEPNPALVRQAQQRTKSIENRVADRITAFAGSMPFVYIHIAWFGCWIGFGVEKYPYGLLTMIVSLEAIFLSIFVLVSQNRQAAKDRVRSDVEYEINVKAELEVAHLHEKTDRLREDMLDRLAKLERLLGGGRPPNPTPRAS